MSTSSEAGNGKALPLTNPPIIEAVLDLDCDLPPGLDISSLEPRARELFLSEYPKFQVQLVQEHQILQQGEAPPEVTSRREVQAFQFLKEDGRQLVQIRKQGFSFNRLAPYSGLDQYLPEIERTWGLFRELTNPVQVQKVSLRFINRIVLPVDTDGRLELEDYLEIGPRLPDEDRLRFLGFLNQHTAVEASTGHLINTTLLSQAPEGGNYPIIFDIAVFHARPCDPGDWTVLAETIKSLRRLKNDVFRNTLTERCLNLFRQ